MDEEVRDGEVPLEVPRKAATLDFGVLRKAETGPSRARWTRTTRKPAPGDSDAKYTGLGPGSQNENPGQ